MAWSTSAGILAKDDPLVGDNESPHAVTFPEWDPVRGPLLELAPRGFPHHPLIFLECDGSGLKAKVDKPTDQTLLRQLLDLLLDGGLSFLLLSLERDPPLLFGLHQPRGLLLALVRKIVELFAQLGFLFLTRKITYEAVPVTEGASLAYRAMQVGGPLTSFISRPCSSNSAWQDEHSQPSERLYFPTATSDQDSRRCI